MKKLIVLLCAIAAFGSCSSSKQTNHNSIIISIEPLRYIIEGIVGQDFQIETLVPAGTSPETYEPTPEQMERLERSQMVFAVGLIGFEQTTVERMTSAAQVPYVALAEGVCPKGVCPEEECLEKVCPKEPNCAHHAECGRRHAECHKHHAECHHHASAEHHNHAHDVNPHLWTSPRKLREMAAVAYRAVAAAWPDSVRYESNYHALLTRLDSLDVRVERRLSQAPSRAFVIYHPTFGYLAGEYGLTEIAIETHGKEPSADHLRNVVDQARKCGVRKVFYQREFPRSVVETVARELDVEPIVVDILDCRVEEMIYEFADKLAQ